MEIDRYYHRDRAAAEKQEWLRRFAEGAPVRIGNVYAAVTVRGGEAFPGPFKALDWTDGVFLAGRAGGREFLFIDGDAAADGSGILTEAGPVCVCFREDLKDVLDSREGEEECAEALIRASSRKWIRVLSKKNAMQLLCWYHRSAPDSAEA